MIFDIAESLIACLDRESAQRLNRFQFDSKILKRWRELTIKEHKGQLTGDDLIQLMFFLHVQNFISVLQKKARAMLRRPPSSNSAPKRR